MTRNACIGLATFLGIVCSSAIPAATYQVGGFPFQDSESLDNRPLVLNGATHSKELAIGFYFPEKRQTVDDVIKQTGSKRIRLVAQETIQTNLLGRVMMERIRQNATDEEKIDNLPQIIQVGAVFAEMPALGRGDILTIDWQEKKGSTEFRLNGKRLGEPIAGRQFFPMLLKVWIGPKTPPAMRDALLGRLDPQ